MFLDFFVKVYSECESIIFNINIPIFILKYN